MTTALARARQPGTKTWVGLVVVLLATFMGQVDMFIVNVAAPGIQTGLDASFGQLQSIINVYVIAYAAGLVTGGRAGDRWGRRRVFSYGAVGFTVASLLCALAPSPGSLIVARALQGAAASALMPQVLSLIRAGFAEGRPRDRAVGAYGATIGLGVIGGLIGGGVLMHLDLAGLGWRSVFLINVPIGAAITLVTPFLVPESRSSTAARTDPWGALLSGSVLSTLLFPLTLGGEAGWPPWSWISLAIAVASLGGFVAHERSLARRGGEPIVPPRLFVGSGFAISMVTVAVFFSGNAGLFLVLTYHLQTGLELGPLATGLAFTPLGVGFAVASAGGNRLADRLGAGVATGGACLMAVSLLPIPLLTGLGAAAQASFLAGVLGVSGLGQGLVVARLLSTVLSHVRADDAGAGSGMFNTVTQAAMAVGVAVLGALYRAVLGTNPSAPTIPLTNEDFAGAFGTVGIVLALLAVTTGFLLERLRRRPADSERPAGTEVGRVTAARCDE